MTDQAPSLMPHKACASAHDLLELLDREFFTCIDIPGICFMHVSKQWQV